MFQVSINTYSHHNIQTEKRRRKKDTNISFVQGYNISLANNDNSKNKTKTNNIQFFWRKSYIFSFSLCFLCWYNLYSASVLTNIIPLIIILKIHICICAFNLHVKFQQFNLFWCFLHYSNRVNFSFNVISKTSNSIHLIKSYSQFLQVP